jgi:hypothetical protein
MPYASLLSGEVDQSAAHGERSHQSQLPFRDIQFWRKFALILDSGGNARLAAASAADPPSILIALSDGAK